MPIEKVYQTIRIGSAKSPDFNVLEENVKLVRNENFVSRIRHVEWDQDSAILTLELFLEIPLKIRLSKTFLRKLEKYKIITCDWEEDWLVEEQKSVTEVSEELMDLVDESNLPLHLPQFQKEGIAWMIGKELQHNSMNPFQHLVPWSTPPKEEIYITFINKTDIVFRRLTKLDRRGGFLCDSPGMGKTVQMVSLMNLNGFHFYDTPDKYPTSQTRAEIYKRKRFYTGVSKVEGGYEATCKGKSIGVYSTAAQASALRDEMILQRRYNEELDRQRLEPCANPRECTGGTLIVADVSLNIYWKHQIVDKSIGSPSIFVWKSDDKIHDPKILGDYDVVIVSPGMIRSESRKTMEQIKNEYAHQEWTCNSYSKMTKFDKPKTKWSELNPMDIVNVTTWGFSFAFTHFDNGHAYGYEYPMENAFMSPMVEMSDDFEWISHSRVEQCQHHNIPTKEHRYKPQGCESCGTPRIPRHEEEEYFQLMRKDTPTIFESIYWRRMIIDESSKVVGHSNSLTFQDIQKIQSSILWCVTANPDDNGVYGASWVSQLGLFGISKEFIRQTRSDAFHDELVNMWIMRRLKENYVKELALPDVVTHVHPFEMSESVREIYDASLNHARRACVRVKKPFSINILIAFQKLLFMCSVQEDVCLFKIENDMILKTLSLKDADQVVEGQTGRCPICQEYPSEPVCTKCNHVFCLGCLQPWIKKKPNCPMCKAKVKPSSIRKLILDELDRDDSREMVSNLCKLDWIETFLSSIPDDEKIVLATQYGPVSQILYSHFEEQACFIHSRLGRAERFEEMNRFEKDDSKRVMVLTVKTAGVGINLTRANHLIMVDVLYKKDTMDQLIGRLHRYGQTREIQVHHLLMKDSLEEKLFNFVKDYHWSAEYICTLLNDG